MFLGNNMIDLEGELDASSESWQYSQRPPARRLTSSLNARSMRVQWALALRFAARSLSERLAFSFISDRMCPTRS